MKKILFFAFVIFIIACNTDLINHSVDAVCTKVPTYTKDAAAIIDNNCALSGCHGASGAKAGIHLDGYTNASKEFLNNLENLASIHHDKGVKSMPRGSAKLNDSLINVLDCWVKNGCPQ